MNSCDLSAHHAGMSACAAGSSARTATTWPTATSPIRSASMMIGTGHLRPSASMVSAGSGAACGAAGTPARCAGAGAEDGGKALPPGHDLSRPVLCPVTVPFQCCAGSPGPNKDSGGAADLLSGQGPGSATLAQPSGRFRSGHPMGYGVIGSPTGSGPVSLGSSPGTPASVMSQDIEDTPEPTSGSGV